MGGKGRRRREKNYNAAHGGYTRLPPPPDYSQADALPSKLRKLLAFTKSHDPQDSSFKVVKAAERKKREHGVDAAEPKPTDEVDFETGFEDEGDAENLEPQHTDEKRKKKRKRKQVHDLRFETEASKQSETRLKRKERKKKYLEAKKNKKKKGKKEENIDFPGREEIKFGDVVQAPPKLVVPKALKNVQDASKERVRVKAIEAYRQRKGWNARPGIQLPPPVTSTAL
ncbi:nucleolar protein 58 [Prunus yedoensis var. nudiflora]|uniref:Nucleolar protein 58 n=1 Tax=Prunus yedoensis var. nudiflora TaxID=2094558 RepID=A0A314UQZ0_PRUYE|nr:nucleolar protein 58 [Prunus yedoensis var. nudiflora]